MFRFVLTQAKNPKFSSIFRAKVSAHHRILRGNLNYLESNEIKENQMDLNENITIIILQSTIALVEFLEDDFHVKYPQIY